MFSKRILMIAGITFLLTGYRAAGAAKAPDLFVKGVSSKPSSMGSAFVAVVNKSDAVYWNSARLSEIEESNVTTAHSALSDFDMSTDMVTYAEPLIKGKSALGVGIFRSTISNIERTVADPLTGRAAGISYFNERELGLMLSYGARYNEKMSYGATLKYLRMSMLGAKSGVGLDLGMSYQAMEGVTFGLNLQNVFQLKLGPDKIPFNAKIGAAYTSPKKRFTVAADLDTNVMSDTVFHIGAEYVVIPNIALRIGADDGDLSLGMGLGGINDWTFDYSYGNGDVGDTQRFTVRYDFVPKGK